MTYSLTDIKNLFEFFQFCQEVNPDWERTPHEKFRINTVGTHITVYKAYITNSFSKHIIYGGFRVQDQYGDEFEVDMVELSAKIHKMCNQNIDYLKFLMNETTVPQLT